MFKSFVNIAPLVACISLFCVLSWHDVSAASNDQVQVKEDTIALSAKTVNSMHQFPSSIETPSLGVGVIYSINKGQSNDISQVSQAALPVSWESENVFATSPTPHPFDISNIAMRNAVRLIDDDCPSCSQLIASNINREEIPERLSVDQLAAFQSQVCCTNTNQEDQMAQCENACGDNIGQGCCCCCFIAPPEQEVVGIPMEVPEAEGGGGGAGGGGGGAPGSEGLGGGGGGGIGGVGAAAAPSSSSTTSITTTTTTTTTTTVIPPPTPTIPEPSTWLILGGMMGLGIYLKYRYNPTPSDPLKAEESNN
jgi:hypothetical protein